jgi:putative transposase
MTVWVQNQGFLINEKRTRRLMQLMDWRTIYREPKTTICNPEHKKYRYLLKNLLITRKNQVWATDITYIPMKQGFMYLIAIIDLHTRFVLNWDVSNTMTAEWCANLLKDTIEKHGCPEIFNTDQGSQYTSDVHTKVLLDNGIKISMDGKGRAIDNIFIERLWRSVKYELRSNHEDQNLNKTVSKMYICSVIQTEKTFSKDLKSILNSIITNDFISR